MSLLLLFNQPAATPTPVITTGGIPRNKPIRVIRPDWRRQEDETIMMLLAKYLEIKESDYVD
jgi:hypothetical protein